MPRRSYEPEPSDPTFPVVDCGIPVLLAEEVAVRERGPATREAQRLEACPACNFNVPKPKIDDALERGQQVSVAGEQDKGVVLSAKCQVHQVDSKCDLDALLLWRMVGPIPVVKLTARNLYTWVARPLGCLGVVCRSGNGLVLRRGLTPVNADGRGHAIPLAAAGDQIAQPGGIGHTPVRFAAASEKAMAREMDVLKVEKDSDILWHTASKEKAPPIPEEGGEL